MIPQHSPGGEQGLKPCVDGASRATWSISAEINARYRSTGVCKNHRLVLNIARSHYR
ncbi:hypothetical protein GKQ23_12895 [Erwinia sp. E602]|nr:hypothetical protein GKQ23_12895 [Erwinia sp. E602]